MDIITHSITEGDAIRNDVLQEIMTGRVMVWWIFLFFLNMFFFMAANICSMSKAQFTRLQAIMS